MDKNLNDFFSLPPGVQPTTTIRMLHGAYQSAKMIEAAENGAPEFPHGVTCPGSPKVSHPLCPPKSPSCKKLTILDSVTTVVAMLLQC